MEEFFSQVAEVITRVNLNTSVTDEEMVGEDYAVLEKAKKLIALACKKQDQDMITARQIKGSDYAKSVKLHRQPRSGGKADPLAELLGELTE